MHPCQLPFSQRARLKAKLVVNTRLEESEPQRVRRCDSHWHLASDAIPSKDELSCCGKLGVSAKLQGAGSISSSC